MILFADENIPECERYCGDLGELRRGSGRGLRAVDLTDVDVLLVRSVTRVDRDLLAHSRVRFVGSCTAGTDHVDQAYLAAAGIAFAHAPGANARSVVEYVWAALSHLVSTRGLDLGQATVGVVGLGQIGLRLYHLLGLLGISRVAFDPLLADGPMAGRASTVEELLAQADVVTLHTPLTGDGLYPTRHLLDAVRLQRLLPGAVLINSSRGAVVDNGALGEVLARRPDLTAVLDVWEGEPEIDLRLMERVALATPHIAGYSYDGMVQGTRLVSDALRRWCGLSAWQPPSGPSPAAAAGRSRPVGWRELCGAMPRVYDIAADDRRLRAAMRTKGARAQAFERRRRDYPVRREASFYRSEDGGAHPLATLLDAAEAAAFG